MGPAKSVTTLPPPPKKKDPESYACPCFGMRCKWLWTHLKAQKFTQSWCDLKSRCSLSCTGSMVASEPFLCLQSQLLPIGGCRELLLARAGQPWHMPTSRGSVGGLGGHFRTSLITVTNKAFRSQRQLEVSRHRGLRACEGETSGAWVIFLNFLWNRLHSVLLGSRFCLRLWVEEGQERGSLSDGNFT